MRLRISGFIIGIAVIVLSSLLVADAVLSYLGSGLMTLPVFKLIASVVLLIIAGSFVSGSSPTARTGSG